MTETSTLFLLQIKFKIFPILKTFSKDLTNTFTRANNIKFGRVIVMKRYLLSDTACFVNEILSYFGIKDFWKENPPKSNIHVVVKSKVITCEEDKCVMKNLEKLRAFSLIQSTIITLTISM
ncbi:hypothetical protein C1646_739100 [Rhizophagus diaphanus]|nr:hypothetical protein C1646_739100 [Rhizophagus diaphanus] [Rhizophagus sp. MUCL 43196]